MGIGRTSPSACMLGGCAACPQCIVFIWCPTVQHARADPMAQGLVDGTEQRTRSRQAGRFMLR